MSKHDKGKTWESEDPWENKKKMFTGKVPEPLTEQEKNHLKNKHEDNS